MKSIQIDKLNLGLILFSFVLACLLPFQLFLIAYAVLGPIHYLTETNWIRDKNYFVVNPVWKYLVFSSAIIYAIPFILRLSIFNSFLENPIIYFLTYDLISITNILLFVVLVAAVLSVFFKTYKAIIISSLCALLFSVWLYKTTTYTLIMGLFLPTIIHVYLFTILFMIYGTRKKNNPFGIANIILIIMLPLLLFFFNTDIFNYHFSQVVKDNYMNNNFHALNANLAKLFGVYDDLKFFFYEKIDLKIQIFITFAYTYHYLNWFSKTTIIGWHKQLTTKKSVVIILIWLLIICCYIYSYKLGLILSIFLSISHVMLEFPLNFITIKALFAKNKKAPSK